jgi:GNAT superfamily N-acetyltransferase
MEEIMIGHPVDSNELREVVELLFSELSPNEVAAKCSALVARFESKTIDPETIFTMRNHNELLGALFATMSPDGSLILFPAAASPRAASQEAILRKLYSAFDSWFFASRTKGAVMVVEQSQPVDPIFLYSVGFEYISKLVYMSIIRSMYQLDENVTQLKFVPMKPNELKQMIDIVDLTYQNTLDFPKMLGISTAEDIVMNYTNVSVFRSELWFFIYNNTTHGDKPIGSLILTTFPEAGEMELTYMGLIEEARGYGYGAEIIRYAESIAEREQSAILLASADQQNQPAIRSYMNAGLDVYDRKSLFLKRKM